jgi:hypothetical protein
MEVSKKNFKIIGTIFIFPVIIYLFPTRGDNSLETETIPTKEYKNEKK